MTPTAPTLTEPTGGQAGVCRSLGRPAPRAKRLGDRYALLPAGKAREQVDLGVLRKFLGPGVAINHPINGDGDATLDEGPERRILLRQIAEQLPDVLCLDYELLLASGGCAEGPPERHLNHQWARRSASSAARMRGGDIGICVMRMPTAFDTAFATAASGGTIDVSPTPRTP